MSYDQVSFLRGLVIGKSLKGWSSGQGSAVPTCWNDEGHYDYFYIDYHQSLAGVTKALFNLSSSVLSENGQIEVTAVEQVNASTLKIVCNLQDLFPGWVAVIGYNSSWLTYASGVQVPEFGAAFWLDGLAPYTFGYIEDQGDLPAAGISGTDTMTMTIPGDHDVEGADAGILRAAGITGEETLEVRYS